MRRSSVLSAVACALALGCAPSNPGLTIDGVLVPTEMCEFTAANLFLVQATLDTAPPAGDDIRYLAVFRVGNHLVNRGQLVYPLMADPNVISLSQAEIEVLNSDGTRFDFGMPNPYRVTAVGAIPSTVSNEPVFGTSVVEVLPPAYGAALAGVGPGTLIFSVRMIGVTSGGATLVSGPMNLPINLCLGCLFSCVVDEMGIPVGGPSCFPGQDRESIICP